MKRLILIASLCVMPLIGFAQAIDEPAADTPDTTSVTVSDTNTAASDTSAVTDTGDATTAGDTTATPNTADNESDDGDTFVTYSGAGGGDGDATLNNENLISITVDSVPLQDVVRMFTKLSDANIIATASNLEGSVTVSLNDVEWRPALQSILEMHGLTLVEKTPNSGIWSIVPRSPDAADPLHVKVIRLKYAKVTDIAPIVETMMTGSLGSVSEFPSRNTIIVRSSSEVLEQVSAFIDEIDMARDQVYIEAKFIELNHGEASSLGIDWQMMRAFDVSLGGLTRTYSDTRTTTEGDERSRSRARGQTVDDTINERIDINGQPFEESTTTFEEQPPGSGNFVANTVITPTRTVTDSITKDASEVASLSSAIGRTVEDARTAVLSAGDLRLVLSALEEMSGVAIVSNPKIIVANEETAEIHIGESEPNIRGTVTPGQQGQANTTTYELDPTQPYFEFGIRVDVTPTVNTESNITVQITPRLTRFVRDKVAPDGNTFPITSEKSIQTEFNLENGKTAAIGGLTETTERDTTTGLPLLRHIPILGKYLFSHTEKQKVQQETIIFVTVGMANPGQIHHDVGIPEYTRDTQRHMLRKQVQSRNDRRELERLQRAADQELEREAARARGDLDDGAKKKKRFLLF